MAIDAIDAQIQSLISSSQLKNEQAVGKEDEADHARKAANKKIATVGQYLTGIIHEAGFWWRRWQRIGRCCRGGGRERVVPPFPRGLVVWR